jgi:hypothetical protein
MYRVLALIPAVLTCTALALAQDEKPKVSFKPTAVSILRAMDKNEFPAYGRTNQTQTQFKLTVPGRKLVRIDEAKSKLTTFEDDKGNSLIDPKDFNPSHFRTWIVSENRENMMVNVDSYSRIPGEGAGKILVKGELVIVCGLAEKTTPEVKFDFTKKADIPLGDLTLRIDPAKKTFSPGYFEMIGEARAIIDLTLLGDNGKKVIAYPCIGPDYSPGARTHKWLTPEKVTAGRLKLTYYSKEESLTVPVDLVFNLGL